MSARFAGDALLVDDQPLGSDLGLAVGDVADSTIQRLLMQRVRFPARVTVGVLHLPGPRARMPWFLSGEPNEMTQSLVDSAAAALSQSARVERVAIVPAMVLADQRTVAALREGAARVQADLLMVYRPTCRLYERAPFIGSTQYRAVCTTEVALLDTRSGVIPFSTVVSQESVTQHQHEDFDNGATWARVQLRAITRGVVLASSNVVNFLSNAPQESDK